MAIPWWVKSGIVWAAAHPVETVAATALLANPTTRVWAARVGWHAGKTAVSSGLALSRGVAVITYEEFILGSRLAAGGAQAARLGAAGAAGYGIGAVLGTAISYKLYGKQGAMDAARFYTNPLGVDYWNTVGTAVRMELGFD